MRYDDDTNFTTIKINGDEKKVWNYGKEIWCNLQGQYTTIVVDNSAQKTMNIKICNLGIMGTKYWRENKPIAPL